MPLPPAIHAGAHFAPALNGEPRAPRQINLYKSYAHSRPEPDSPFAFFLRVSIASAGKDHGPLSAAPCFQVFAPGSSWASRPIVLMHLLEEVASREPICWSNEDIDPGAQTKRRGSAGPVRILLGGKASPASFVVRTNPSCC
jgi:hypothetical protein